MAPLTNEALAMIDSATQSMPIGLWVVDETLTVRAVNTLGMSLLGIEPFNMLDIKNVSGLLPLEIAKTVRNISADDYSTGQGIIQLANRDVSFTITRAQDAAPWFGSFLVVLQNASELRQIEKVKREFVSTILHQIRNPLSTIKISLSMLKAGLRNSTNEMEDVLGMATHEASRLHALLNDLRDLFLIDTGLVRKDLVLEDFSISEALVPVINELNNLPSPYHQCKQRITLYEEGAVRTNADYAHTKQILRSLLKNAIAYSDPTSSITVGISNDAQSVQITISDTGSGIDEKSSNLLFTKFFRENNVTNQTLSGSGLGLFIARAFAEAMNGTLYIVSAAARGTTAILRLPAARDGTYGIN